MSEKALVTGITGQDGSYLAELLIGKGHEVHGIIRWNSSFNRGTVDHLLNNSEISERRLFLYYGDITHMSNLDWLLEKVHPHEIYDLPAEANAKLSRDPGMHSGT